MAIVDLTSKRLERLEKAQKQTNQQLGQIVNVLEVHSRHFERIEDALIGIAERVDNMAGRMDRLATAIARGRTQDLVRLDDHERRLRNLERRNGRRRRR